MKYFFSLLILAPIITFSQRTEFSYSTEVGYFNFGGKSATEIFNLMESQGEFLLENPYSRRKSLDLGLRASLINYGNQGMFGGIGIGVNHTRSRINVNRMYDSNMKVNGQITTKHLLASMIYTFGYRQNYKSYTINYSLDFKMIIPLLSHEEGSVIDQNQKKINISKRRNLPIDHQIGLLVSCFKGRNGLSVSYSYGLTNIMTGEQPTSAYSNSRRFSIGFVRRVLVGRLRQNCFYRKKRNLGR